MLLNSGAPSLVSYTRLLAGDDGVSGIRLFSDTQIKQVASEEYVLLRESWRDASTGVLTKVTYLTSVAQQILYGKPADLLKSKLVELATDGSSLALGATSATTPIVQLIPTTAEDAYRLHNGGELSGPEFFFVQDASLGIVSPPEVGGANAIRLLYEGTSAALVNDTDEPLLPSVFHPLICYETAATLRGSRDLPFDALLTQKWMLLKRDFSQAAKEIAVDRTSKAAIAGSLVPTRFFTRQGFVKKTRRSARDIG